MLGFGLGVWSPALQGGFSGQGGSGSSFAASSVSQRGVSFEFDQALEVGTVGTSVAYVELPSGTAQLTGVSPGQALDGGGLIINGAELNPQQVVPPSAQGYDERGRGWDAARSLTYPATIQAGDVIIKSVGSVDDGGHPRNGVATKYVTLFVLGSAPSTDATPPASIGWESRGIPEFLDIDYAAFIATLPSFDAAGQDAPPFQDLMQRLDNFAPVWPQAGSDVSFYQDMAPRDIGGTATGASNYGQCVAATVNAACIGLISNRYTQSEKVSLARALTEHGIQWLDPFLQNGNFPAPNGGHYQFHLVPMVLAAHLTGREISLVMENCAGNFAQYFQLTAGQVADLQPHDDMTKPYIARRRPVTSVSGNTVDVEVSRSGETGDPAQVSFVGMKLTRESDGQSAIVVSQNVTSIPANTIGTVTLTLDAQPVSPFAGGDVVHAVAVDAVSEGDYNWVISGVGEYNKFSPAAGATYRNLNQITGQVMFLAAAGFRDEPSLEAVFGYVLRANQSNNPSAADDYPMHHSAFSSIAGQTYSWDEEFWEAHAGEIFPSLPAPEALESPFVVNTAFFRDPSNVPANTTVIEYEAKYIPRSMGAVNNQIMGQVACGGWRFGGSGRLAFSGVADSGGDAGVSRSLLDTISSRIYRANILVDFANETVTRTIDGVVDEVTPMTTATTRVANTSRQLVVFAYIASAQSMPQDWEFEYVKIWLTTGGVRSLHKEISVSALGSLENINSDPWLGAGTVLGAGG